MVVQWCFHSSSVVVQSYVKNTITIVAASVALEAPSSVSSTIEPLTQLPQFHDWKGVPPIVKFTLHFRAFCSGEEMCARLSATEYSSSLVPGDHRSCLHHSPPPQAEMFTLHGISAWAHVWTAPFLSPKAALSRLGKSAKNSLAGQTAEVGLTHHY